MSAVHRTAARYFSFDARFEVRFPRAVPAFARCSATSLTNSSVTALPVLFHASRTERCSFGDSVSTRPANGV